MNSAAWAIIIKVFGWGRECMKDSCFIAKEDVCDHLYCSNMLVSDEFVCEVFNSKLELKQHNKTRVPKRCRECLEGEKRYKSEQSNKF